MQAEMLLSYWALLGFVVWTLVLLVAGIGVPRVSAVLSGRARPNSFNPAVPHGSDAYQRRMRAHLNCVENPDGGHAGVARRGTVSNSFG
jgi:hypothetical protein